MKRKDIIINIILIIVTISVIVSIIYFIKTIMLWFLRALFSILILGV